METRPRFIEGRLMEMGHEPRNTQVVFKEDERIFLALMIKLYKARKE